MAPRGHMCNKIVNCLQAYKKLAILKMSSQATAAADFRSFGDSPAVQAYNACL